MKRFRDLSPWGPIPPPPGPTTWESLMREALSLARESEKEVPVGALVVDAQGRIIGKGRNSPITTRDPTAHAEIAALRDAGTTLGNYRLYGCVLVVTLEPCLMCVGALVQARVAGVVYGAGDAKAGAVMSCLQGLDLPFHNHRVWHLGGVLSIPCAAVLERFFHQRRGV